MKTLSKYQCELCYAVYDEKEIAERCEARGIPTPWPMGMIFANHRAGDFKDYTYCVMREKVKEHDTVHNPTLYTISCNAERFTPVITGTQSPAIVASLFNHSLCRQQATVDPSTASFKLMVKNLNERNIPITVWDGEKPVPLEEWYKVRKCICTGRHFEFPTCTCGAEGRK